MAVSSPTSGDFWWLTSVYGPQGDVEKLAFQAELQELRALITEPWLIGVDFNMITCAGNKNNDRVNHRTMNCFHLFIVDFELHDLYLHGTRYT